MGKRVICLICAAVLMIVSTLGTCAAASAWHPTALPTKPAALVRTKSTYRPNALVSAMFLVLAGVGVSLLFDKKDKEH